MKAYWFASRSFFLSAFGLLLISISLLVAQGCGSGSMTPPKPHGNTAVTVLLSSTANDQVSRFAVQFQSLTLTSQSGKTVTLLSSQQPSEFMHLNGGIEPLTTVNVPQDVYTSATLTLGSALFVCIAQVPSGGLGFANYSVINQGPTVNWPASVTVTGDSMALLLNMDVSASAVFPTCWTTPPFQDFSMAPTFSLTPMTVSPSPTNSANGKVNGLKALVSSLGSTPSAMTLTVAGGPYGTRSLVASSNSATTFQGISGASSLVPGMFLNLDGAIQPDGSLLATRIEVENSSAVNLLSGPIMQIGAPLLMQYGRNELGPLLTIGDRSGVYGDIANYDFSSAIFRTSGQFANLQSLPFVASFNAANMVVGQEVDITPPYLPLRGGDFPSVETITLIPQTINGTVIGSQQVGSFVDYTVSLAAYDLFPTLATQPGQTSPLTNPAQVEVYVDSNTQKVNKAPIAAGSTFRFYGLVFNDNGTLRMDCAQVSDGVSQALRATANMQFQRGTVQGTVRPGIRTPVHVASKSE